MSTLTEILAQHHHPLTMLDGRLLALKQKGGEWLQIEHQAIQEMYKGKEVGQLA